MLRILPIVAAILYGLIMYRVSIWRTHRELDQKSTELADVKLKQITDRLAAALEVKRIPVFIYEIDPINGLAAPDGRIFITRGFYNAYRAGDISAEELGSVIAHELGHVALGHAKKRMIDFSGQNALRTVLMMILGRYIPVIGAWIANFLTKLIAARLSREDEYEADEYAAALLSKAGYGLTAQKSLFEKLEKLTHGRAGLSPAWLMSHPQTADRIAALERLEDRWAKR
ncbi:M48 family metallopeptidase [Epibacterium ulvae]|uniref:M48 family metallopeptidase n=1 Tax=Epibacterium ulvae TaxID=1156985 RepID=UPI00248FDA37|nr:M48 family metallopeptidase [Epibacterium ulvae]